MDEELLNIYGGILFHFGFIEKIILRNVNWN